MSTYARQTVTKTSTRKPVPKRESINTKKVALKKRLLKIKKILKNR